MVENGYMTRPQSLERIKKIIKVLGYFDKNGGTINEISEALKIPKSSVQRYLNAAEEPEVRRLIKEYLDANKKEGNKKGGQTSQEKYGYTKDECGKFNRNK